MKLTTICLINPNIVSQKGDLAGSGIPYWPTTLAYAAATLRQNDQFKIHVIDAFGEDPQKIQIKGNSIIQGITSDEIIERLKIIKPQVIVSYAGIVMTHDIHLEILTKIKKSFFKLPLIVLENTQQVTSYKLEKVLTEFLDLGVDYIYSGEPEKHLSRTINLILKKNTASLKKIPGLSFLIKDKLHTSPTDQPIWDLDNLPRPAWDLFPVKNYWELGYSHGPKTSFRFMPLYTSRGCPFGCAFCTVPQLNNRLWRGRTGKNVAEEMQYWHRKWGVSEFHIEDVNPALVGPRMIDLSSEIIKRKLPVVWKIVSGTKVEALTPITIQKMAQAGCNYISISPESGSPRMLKLMNKPFAHNLALELVGEMHRYGITTQACFVLGFPGENESDRQLTWSYVKKLAKNGLDEIAPFIMTPIPGSAQWGKKKGYKHLSELTFSPIWRKDFSSLHLYRLKLFAWFMFWRIVYNPISILKSLSSFITGNFYTKTEMTIFRLLKIKYWVIVNAA